MRHIAMLAALLLTGGLYAAGQESGKPLPQPEQVDTTRADRSDEDTDTTFGRIKEIEDKNKIVIAVDNAPDKTYSLTDKDKVVRLADGLAVGDRVKVMERETGDRETVDIVRDSGTGERARER